MKLSQIVSFIDGKVDYGVHMLDIDFKYGFSSDTMSDVLAYVKNEDTLMLTGLNNLQVVRTADMLNIKAVIIVRGKTPWDDVVALARELDVAIISTSHSMFSASGILYLKGLQPARI